MTCVFRLALKDKKYGSYTLPLVLYNRDRPTTPQKLFVDVLKKIQSVCEPKPKSCLYGTDQRPTLYPRLIFDKYDMFVTRLYQRKNIESNEDSTRVEPKKFLDKSCHQSGQCIFGKECVLTTTRS